MSTGEPEASVTSSADEAALRQEIEQTRERLGETVERLAAKTDVKGQARAKVTDVQARVRSGAQQAVTTATALAKQPQVQLGIAGVLLIAGLAALRRWRTR